MGIYDVIQKHANSKQVFNPFNSQQFNVDTYPHNSRISSSRIYPQQHGLHLTLQIHII